MSRPILPPRRPGPLPEIPLAENDEILSSWLSRSAALYRARPEALLEQVGLTELSPAILERQGTPADLDRLSAAMYSSPQAIRRMSFAGQPREALELVAHRAPLWTCRQCAEEFISRGLAQIRLRQWFIAVASICRRCGGRLTQTRIRGAELFAKSTPPANSMNCMPKYARELRVHLRAEGPSAPSHEPCGRSLRQCLPINGCATSPATVGTCPIARGTHRRSFGSSSVRGSCGATHMNTGVGDHQQPAHLQNGRRSDE
jgi:hypothetical protein